MGVVQDEVLQIDELALVPQCRNSLSEIGPRDPALSEWARTEPLVETSKGVISLAEGAGYGVTVLNRAVSSSLISRLSVLTVTTPP
jgi:hypothetical protein